MSQLVASHKSWSDLTAFPFCYEFVDSHSIAKQCCLFSDLQVIPAGVESSGKSNAFQKSSINYQQLVPNTHKFRMNVRPLHNIVSMGV